MEKSIVSAKWLKENMKLKDLVILDASPQANVSGLVSDHKGVQIASARPISLKTKFSKKDTLFPNTHPEPKDFQIEARKLGVNNESTVVVYDNLGIYTSPRVWWLFKTMGLEDCFVLDGGLPEWMKAGGETEPILSYQGGEGNYKAKFIPKAWRNLKEVEANINTRKELVLDARSEGRFRGATPEPREGLSSGSIPNSKNLPFKIVLENGKLKSKAELQILFKEINKENQPLVFTCGSGLTACISLLAASQVLENPLSVYDGSWTEWASLNPNLIEKGKK